jgi:hypothetical protein
MPSEAHGSAAPASAAIVGATSRFETRAGTTPPVVHGERIANGTRIEPS